VLRQNTNGIASIRSESDASLPQKVLNVVGAGDTFAAGYLFARVTRNAEATVAWRHEGRLVAVKIASPTSVILDSPHDNVISLVDDLDRSV